MTSALRSGFIDEVVFGRCGLDSRIKLTDVTIKPSEIHKTRFVMRTYLKFGTDSLRNLFKSILCCIRLPGLQRREQTEGHGTGLGPFAL